MGNKINALPKKYKQKYIRWYKSKKQIEKSK